MGLRHSLFPASILSGLSNISLSSFPHVLNKGRLPESYTFETLWTIEVPYHTFFIKFAMCKFGAFPLPAAMGGGEIKCFVFVIVNCIQ